MPRLVLLNGLPGSGKSTIARRYAEDHPLTLVLDVDVVRGLLGVWRNDPAQAGLVARDLALTMARRHLLAGRDVVVPQFLGRADFVLELALLAAGVDVPFVELVLIVEPAEAVRRFVHRSAHPTRPEDRDAAALLDRHGGLNALPELQAQLTAVLAARPQTLRLPADASSEDTYRRLLTALASWPPPPS